MAVIWSTRLAWLLRNGNAMNRFYIFQFSIASTTQRNLGKPAAGEQLLCSPTKLRQKGFSQGCSSAAPQHADYYWGKVVQLQDRDAGGILAFGTATHRPNPKPLATYVSIKSSESTSIPTGQTIPRLANPALRSEEHTSELQSQSNLVCRLLLEKKNSQAYATFSIAESQVRWPPKNPVLKPTVNASIRATFHPHTSTAHPAFLVPIMADGQCTN